MLRRLILFSLLLLAAATPLRGQLTDVKLTVESQDVGIGGYVQDGQWMPMHLKLTNQSAQVRNIEARWLVRDEDGDEVIASRAAPLNPAVEQRMWLYAPLPLGLREGQRWIVQVIDPDANIELARMNVNAARTVPIKSSMIGVCGSTDMGLRDFEPGYTQHEPLVFVRGLTLAQLPDRWYGLSCLNALIWTGEAADPNNDPQNAAVTPQAIEALRGWIRRGGHLVLVLPLDQTWSDSAMGDLMPVDKAHITAVDDFNAIRVVVPPTGVSLMIPALTFDTSAAESTVVLARDQRDRPYIVAKRYGFGRVTLIGVDLTSPTVRRLGTPVGQDRIWHKVFHWTAPVYTQSAYESETREGRMMSMMSRQDSGVGLDDIIGPLIAMTGTAAPALLSAILIFMLYWLAAGPLAFLYLRRTGRTQHAWLAFLLLVGVFTAITWGGAWVIRPSHTRLEHLTVLDIDANNSMVRTRSWLTLLVPHFGRATVALDADGQYPGAVLASPGIDPRAASIAAAGGGGGGFLDPQRYQVDTADPRSAEIPVRSTAKRFTLDYLGRLDKPMPGLETAWSLPQGSVQMDAAGAWPTGKLVHHLPGNLKNVMIVYCPGNTTAGELYPPWAGLIRDWPAGQELTLSFSPPNAIPMMRLIQRPSYYGPNRTWDNEGFLGQQIAAQKGRQFAAGQTPLVADIDDNIFRMFTFLCFYDTLPPPDFRTPAGFATPLTGTHYERTLLRHIDMTDLIAGRRLILIGQLENSPLPAPLTLDGGNIPSQGLTIVRWVYDL
ncbi:MAG: hypothetical protein IT445_09420 [Phycisphaeraceae bacterium]|nr:hypothetical protein [Phycisphaeraceae bacterium]